MIDFALKRIRGRTLRLINSRYPPIDIFDGLYDTEEEKRIALELELATNPRANEILGRLSALPQGSLPVEGRGDGAAYVVASFLYTSQEGGRYNGEGLGAWYAARNIKTAIAETSYHNERRLRASVGGFPNRIQLRELVATIDLRLVDIRGLRDEASELYHSTDYTGSQAFANDIRWPHHEDGKDGLVYDSVRHDGGENIVIFRPQAIPLPVMQGDHYQYDWDRNGEMTVSKLSGV
ncbi:RES family NAD+ phosphorylase [Parvularcula sp. IMCC14364]|uniref:RES family NAD+ phosphorylase n=1 Tax=Parvularcula sp. IMCC14364 TaxID=3067902 RepID=UPI0027424A1D|nr:RES family NAD+ phosphorylase [Parvularcula sp. IMCC14364]